MIYPLRVTGGREGERSVVIHFTCRDRHTARNEIGLFHRSLLPPGHVIDEEHINAGRDPEKNPRPGRKVNVTIVMYQNDIHQPTVDYEVLERQCKVLDYLG